MIFFVCNNLRMTSRTDVFRTWPVLCCTVFRRAAILSSTAGADEFDALCASKSATTDEALLPMTCAAPNGSSAFSRFGMWMGVKPVMRK